MSLDDLLNSPDVGPQENSLRVCLAGKLLPKVKACVEELAAIEEAVNREPKVSAAFDAYLDSEAAEGDEEERSSATKLGQSRSRLRKKYETLFEATRKDWPGYTEKRAELEDLNARMRAAEAVVVMRAGDEGDWLRFVADNPPRRRSLTTKDKDGNEQVREALEPVDLDLAQGRCNAEALLTSLPRYLSTVNGEHVTEQDALRVLRSISGGDRRDMCRMVVDLHEGNPNDPKLLSGLLDNLRSGDF